MKRLLALVCAVARMGAPAARGLCLALFVLAPFGVALAQEKPATPPPQVDELVRLLDDPAVRAWLDSVRGQPPGASEAAAPASVESEASMSLALQLSRMRAHLQGVAAAVPGLPAEIAQAGGVLKQDLAGRSFAGLLVLIAAFVVFGMGSEHAFWWATRRTRAWIGGHPLATVPQRLRMIGMRLAYGLVLVAIFGIGSVGAFLLFDWPPVLRVLVLGVLMAVLIVRFALILGRVLLVPGGRWLQEPDRYRVIPMTTEEARYWQTRLAAFVGYFAFGWVVVGLLHPLGFTPPMRMAAAYLLGLGLLAIGLVTLWGRPHREARPGGIGRTAVSALLTAYGVVLWLLWVAGLDRIFWLAVVALLLPKAISIGQSAVGHLLRPADDDGLPTVRRGVLEVCVERGLRVVLIAAAAYWLAHVWGVDVVALSDRDNIATRLVRGALTSVVVLIVADFIWQVVKAVIAAKLEDTGGPQTIGSEAAVRQARMRTLLPIFRNILLVVIMVMAGLTALSALGIEIGPLIAGAGVVGVAVGFGAQTVVKDIISGIFYLLDDAFRVGEYIQSGNYKGTVESFSLRSVKLRHHRGPVYTVPFGSLGAVQNMSRDWVIDKFAINVTYDTDLEKARKLVKAIGQDLAKDPEFGKRIIEPLKMQGVEQFGDYAIEVRLKMTTLPGEQFVIRRKALARIKQAFDENGIHFAFPTVQVSGGGDDQLAAAARQSLDRMQQEKPAA